LHIIFKDEFHWDQFLVANVTRKSTTGHGLVTRKSGMSGVSPTCYEEVTKKLETFRPSPRVKMVWRVANFFVTSSRTCYEEVGDVANKSSRKLRGS